MFDNSGDYNQKATWGNITVPENSTVGIDASSRCNINGSISGAGTLNYYVPYVRADLVGGGNNFTGKLMLQVVISELQPILQHSQWLQSIWDQVYLWVLIRQSEEVVPIIPVL